MAKQDLPIEIWSYILHYVSLEDRLKNVQFVSKRFHALCYDSMLAKHVHFGSAVFMPDKVALRYIQSVKRWIVTLSLNECHWFTSNLLGKIPKLVSLETLDMAGCFITGSQLLRLLQKTPNLKNLSVSLAFQEFGSLAKDWPQNASLDRLHFDSVVASPYLTNVIFQCYTEFVLFLRNYLVDTLPDTRKSLSLDLWGEGADELIKMRPYYGCGSHAIDYKCSKIVPGSSDTVCTDLYSIALHKQGPGMPDNCFSSFDHSKLRFLSLPSIKSTPLVGIINYACSGSRCPDVFPGLQCLIVEWRSGCRYLECYEALKKKIILHCKYPNLKSLNLGREEDCSAQNQAPIIADFYTRLSSFQSLQELNLRNLPIDLYLLLDSVKHLKQIHSLSIPLNESVLNDGDAMVHGRAQNGHRVSRICEVSNVSFFLKLVETFPDLKRLEIAQSLEFKVFLKPNFLRPLGNLLNLELLSLANILCIEPLRNMLKGCVRLKSLTLSDVGKLGNCEYASLLSGFSLTSPSLVELRLKHPWLNLSTMLFNEFAGWKVLEKLVLKREAGMSVRALEIVYHFRRVMDSCPVLHMFALVATSLPISTCSEVRKFAKELKRNGRNAALFCGLLEQYSSDHVPHALLRYIEVFSSAVGVYNPFNFPYAE